MKRWTIAALCVVLCLLLCGCSLRTRVLPQETQMNAAAGDEGQGTMAADAAGQSAVTGEDSGLLSMELTADAAAEPDPNAPVTHSNDADRREYADNVSAEMTAEASQSVALTTEDDTQPSARQHEASASEVFPQEQAQAELTLTERRPIEEADELTVNDEAKAADSMLQYYQTLLTSRLGSMFECQRLYVYWETVNDDQTVHKSSVEHTIITLAGGYDVAAKRPEDALLIDDGWVSRKDPGCVVKVFPRDMGMADAQSLRAALMNRPAWSGVSAVRAGRVLLMNECLLDTPEGQTAAALILAQTMYPSQLQADEMNEAMQALLGDMPGVCLYLP